MIKDVMFFANGNTAIFDEHGEQVAEAQEPWLIVYFKHLIQRGALPTGTCFTMPNGRSIEVFKTEEGWNWGMK